MKYEIYEMMTNIHAELIDAGVMYRAKNSDEAVKIWKHDECRKVERLFEAAINAVHELETFFCEGDELLPEAEHQRLKEEFAADLSEGLYWKERAQG